MTKISGSPDGYVLIDTKMPTDNIEEGAEEIKEELREIGDQVKKAAEEMMAAFDDTGDAAADAATTLKAEGDQIGEALDDIADEADDASGKIGGAFGTIFSASAAAEIATQVIGKIADALKQFAIDSLEVAANMAASASRPAARR